MAGFGITLVLRWAAMPWWLLAPQLLKMGYPSFLLCLVFRVFQEID